MTDESMSYLDALKEIKRLKEALDKIRAEIEEAIQEETVVNMNGGEYEHTELKLDPDDVLQIIDKHLAELRGDTDA